MRRMIVQQRAELLQQLSIMGSPDRACAVEYAGKVGHGESIYLLNTVRCGNGAVAE